MTYVLSRLKSPDDNSIYLGGLFFAKEIGTQQIYQMW